MELHGEKSEPFGHIYPAKGEKNINQAPHTQHILNIKHFGCLHITFQGQQGKYIAC